MAEARDLRQVAHRVRAALTPHPHRGDLIAAGAAPLALGIVLVNLRLDAEWGTGVFLVLTALACGLVLGMGILAPLEGERPRAYQQVLQLAGLVLLLVTLTRLAEVLGADDPLGSSGSTTWIFGLLTLTAGWLVVARRSAICALVAAIAGIVAVLSFVDWAFDPDGLNTARWVLVALAIGLVLAALSQRDVNRRESVYLIDAAGVAILLIALTFVGALIGQLLGGLASLAFEGALPGGGWKLILVGSGFGLVAYAAVDRESGPAYVGVAILFLFAIFAAIPGAEGASLWFWPLVLLLLGGAAVVAGLRPRRPLPPEPPGAGAPAEPVPGPGSGSRPSGGLWAVRRPEDDTSPG